MPRLSVWFVRAALLYLVAGLTLGLLMLWNKGEPFNPLIWRLLPIHIEFLLLGWIVQLALGVAYWILPRWNTRRGDVRPAWAALVLLNLGICLVVLTTWWGLADSLLLVGRLCEAAAAAAFAWHAWPRVKPWVEAGR